VTERSRSIRSGTAFALEHALERAVDEKGNGYGTSGIEVFEQPMMATS
jgi:hypothetical protein